MMLHTTNIPFPPWSTRQGSSFKDDDFLTNVHVQEKELMIYKMLVCTIQMYGSIYCSRLNTKHQLRKTQQYNKYRIINY